MARSIAAIGILLLFCGIQAQAEPVITSQPADQSVVQGLEASFAVEAQGLPPVTYQWYVNNEPILHATNASHLIPQAQVFHAGLYRVVVSDTSGTVASDEARLVVLIPPIITTQPFDRTIGLGNTVSFSVNATGTQPLFYQWRKDGADLAGQTNRFLTFTNVQISDEGFYSVFIENEAGPAFSRAAQLRVLLPPVIVEHPMSQTATQGHAASFSVTVEGSEPLIYQWYFNATNLLIGETGRTLTLSEALGSDAGAYVVEVRNAAGQTASDEAVLTVLLAPLVTTQPQSQAVPLGKTATFTVEASGDPAPEYQWRFEGVDLPGQKNASLTVPNVGEEVEGTYDVVVANIYGTAVSAPAELSIAVPPFVIESPADVVVARGETVQFEVTAGGTPPLRYQWFRENGMMLAGATNAVLIIANAQVTAAGEYYARVSNAAGEEDSAGARLEVLGPPVILSGPEDTFATNTQPAVLSVDAAGSGPLRFQWYFQGAPLLALTNQAAFVQPASSPALEGFYQVAISNEYGGVLSRTAYLGVLTEDFGDAGASSYPTRRADNGARHLLRPGYHLGVAVDFEDDGQPDGAALGDDGDGMDDEDGVKFNSPLVLGNDAEVSVMATSNGFLNVWVDFNRDGDWADAGEQIFTDDSLAPGNNVLSFEVPSSADVGASMARFRFGSAPGLPAFGPAPDGEVEDYAVRILPAFDLAVSIDGQPPQTVIGNEVGFTVTVRNAGPDVAPNVVVTHPLPRTAELLSVDATQGSCETVSGVLECSLGSLAPDASAEVSLRFRVTTVETISSAPRAVGEGFDVDLGDNRAFARTVVTYPVPDISNGDVIVMPEFLIGPSTPYPSTITVSGQTAAVYKVTVTIRGMTHTFPDDLDILLVGPQGQNVVLMSDVGSGFLTPISNVTLTFDDDAAAELPDGDQIFSGTYRPSNSGPVRPDQDTFEPPAPEKPHGATLSVFEGANPNGDWSLYVRDDSPEDTGYFAGGWELSLTLADPVADLGAGLAAFPDPVPLTSNLVYAVSVTNSGPAPATHVTLRGDLPPGTHFVSASGESESCVEENGIVICDVGDLAVGEVGQAGYQVRVAQAGSLTNTVMITSNQQDTDMADNVLSATTSVILINDVRIVAEAAPLAVLLGQSLAFRFHVINDGPFAATSVTLTNILPAEVEFLAVETSAGDCAELGGIVRCELGHLPVGTEVEVTIMGRATALGSTANLVFVGGEQSDTDVSNNVVEAAMDILPAVNLAVAQAKDRDSLIAGESYAYSLMVSNQGPNEADMVSLLDAISPHAQFMQATPSQGACTIFGDRLICDLGEMAAGGMATVDLQVRGTASGTATNTVQVNSEHGDPDESDNVAVALTSITPAADLAVRITDRPDSARVGQVVTYSVMVSNAGPDTATGVVVSNAPPAGAQSISASSSQGECVTSPSGIVCELGALPSGGIALVSLNVIPQVTGLITNSARVEGSLPDLDESNNHAQESTRVLINAGSFANDARIEVPEFGPADVYPSTIQVSGVTARVDQVSVTLHGMHHPFPDDLDILLVGPNGQSSMLWSDAGGGTPLVNVTISLDPFANRPLPDDDAIMPARYVPADYDPDSDVFPEPAPGPPYAADLSIFQETDVNGTWSLYVRDDFTKDAGSIDGGWSLSFGTTEILNDLGLLLSLQPRPAAVSGLLTYQAQVRNHGPGPSDTVRLISQLPLDVDLIDMDADAGSCVVEGELIVCDLGPMVAGQIATVDIMVRPRSPGPLVFSSQVEGQGTDVRYGNNTAYASVEVEHAPSILVAPFGLSVTNGLAARFQVVAEGSAPLRYQWFRDGMPLADQTNASLTIQKTSGADAGDYTVRIENPSGAVTSPPARLTLLNPVAITVQPGDQTAFAGGQVLFQVAATGTGPLRYQWYFDESPLPNRTSATLLVEAVDASDAGNYRVEVMNALNSVSSMPAHLTVLTADFGDAPGAGSGYPTLLNTNGARHVLAEGVHLGRTVDFEPDGSPSAFADGDDARGVDDEDGVTFLTALVPNAEAEVEVVASTGGILDAWIDYDGNGNWNGGNERIFDGAVLVAGTNRLAFVVPVEAVASDQTYARFRFSTAGGLSPDGLAMDGEVEDYAVSVVRRADLAVTMADFPDPATVNFNLVYEIGVTNRGPLRATGVRAAAGLPPNALLIGLSSSQGGCTASPFPACDLGELAVGDGAIMTVIVVPLAQGMFTNTASASSQEIDPDAANNQAMVTTRVLERARILAPPASQAVTLGQPAAFTVQASGAPLFYQWRFNDSNLAGETNAVLTLDSVQLSDAGTYSVVVSNELNLLVSAPAQLTVVVPPMFITHPSSQAVPYGGNVVFNGLAEGTAPISYQWLLNGAELPGATAAELSLTDLEPAQAGAYTLRARNNGGEATSDPAVLTLNGAPVIIEHPANQTALAGGEARLTVRAAGSAPLSVQWYYDGDTPLDGAADFVLTLTDVQQSDAGPYHAVVTNMEGEAVSETAILEVVAMDFGDASEPGYATTLAADGARHRLVDGVFLGTSVDFEPDGAPTSDATGDDQAQDDDEDGVSFNQPWPVGQIAEIQVVASVEGLLNAWVDFNGNGAWTDAGDRIFADQLLQPGVNQLSFLVPSSATARGTQARFRFSTAGDLAPTGEALDGEVEDYAVLVRHEADLVLNGSASPNPVAVGEPTTILLTVLNQGPAFASRAVLTNQLPENFVLTGLAGDRAESCTNMNGVLVCDLGLIGSGQVAAVAVEGHATAPGLLRNQAFITSVEEDAVPDNNVSLVEFTALEPPSILEPPASLTLTNGATATFSVTAAGSMPLTYRWLRNGVPLSAGTNAVLTIDGIDPGDAGNYSVRVANPVGAVNSDAAILNVLVPARIVQPPASMTVLAGSRVEWRVVAAGNDPLTYQWSRDGAPLASATSDVLVIPDVQVDDTGTYEVTVMNPLATVTSAPAELTVRETDFGDAPSPGYLTMLAQDGARHYLVPGVRLGDELDFEADGQPVALAAGDDLIGADDEDGVIFLTPLRAGQSASVRVEASRGGFLNAWVDYNADGDWSDPEEQIFVDRALSAGANTLAFTLPSQTVPGDSHARFRFSTTGGDGIGGLALDGEVEDHAVRLATVADLAVSAFSTPSMAAIGSPVFTSVTVTNHGPGDATDVLLSDVLPASWQLNSVLVSQGGCSIDGGELACDFGTIPAGRAAHVLIEAVPLGEGIFEELFTVGSADLDPVSSNNEISVATMVQTLPLIVAHPHGQAASPGGTVMFSVEAIGAPPLAYQWRLNGMPISGETGTGLLLADVQMEDLGSYDVVVSNPNGAATSDPAELFFADAPSLATLPAENVGATTADLVAEVTPNGLLTVAWFEWGTSEAYGNVTFPGSAGRGQQTVHFISTLGNLAPETTYHFRAVATNDLGKVEGENQMFVTGVLPPFITGISRQAGGTVRIEFTGKEGQPYEVRGAQILNDWTTLGPATDLGGGLFEFEDAGAADFDARFYQVVLP